MMVLAIGLSSYNLSLFHLINHAFYKALLFLGAGSVIHAIHDNQDLRKYGGLKSFLPLSYTVTLIASLSLIALPFMSGFYSKDFILESAIGQYSYSSKVVYFLALTGAAFTVLYSIKILHLTFISTPNGYMKDYNNAHEGDLFMSIPLIILAIFSIFFGFLTKDMFVGLGSSFFSDNAIFIHPSHEIMLETEFSLSYTIKTLPIIVTICSFLYYNNKIMILALSGILITIITGYSISVLNISFLIGFILLLTYILENNKSLVYKCNLFLITSIKLKLGLNVVNIYKYNIFNLLSVNMTNLFNQRLFIELFYNRFISGVVLKLGGQTTKFLDKGSIEYIGPYGLEIGLLYLSKKISKLDSGIITSYALYILSGLVIYLYVLNFMSIDELILVTFVSIIYIIIK